MVVFWPESFVLLCYSGLISYNCFSVCQLDDNQKKKKCNFADKTKKKLQKLFFLHSSREKFPTHHQHFFVPGLRTKNHKMFYDRKKDIIWCFQQTYLILLHTRKKVIAFLFYFEKVVLFDWQAETCSNILTLSNRPAGRPADFFLSLLPF